MLTAAAGAAAGLLAGSLLGHQLQQGRFLRGGEQPARWVDPAMLGAAGAALGAVAPVGSWWATVLWGVSAAACLALSVVDLQVQRIPDRVLQPWAVAVVALLLVAVPAGALGWGQLVAAVLAAAVCGGGALVLGLVTRGGIGLGDVKLIGLMGLALGWSGWAAILLSQLVAWVLAAVSAITLRLAGRRTQELPMGPFLAIGLLAGLRGVLGGL